MAIRIDPTDAITDVLFNELPRTAAEDTARAIVGYLNGLGYSIVRTDDHVSRADLNKLADAIENEAAYESVQYATAKREDANAIRHLIRVTKQQS